MDRIILSVLVLLVIGLIILVVRLSPSEKEKYAPIYVVGLTEGGKAVLNDKSMSAHKCVARCRARREGPKCLVNCYSK